MSGVFYLQQKYWSNSRFKEEFLESDSSCGIINVKNIERRWKYVMKAFGSLSFYMHY